MVGELGLGEQVGCPVTLSGDVGQVNLSVQVAQRNLNAVQPTGLPSGCRDIHQVVVIQCQPDSVVQLGIPLSQPPIRAQPLPCDPLGNTFQLKESLGCRTLPIHCYAIGLQGIGHMVSWSLVTIYPILLNRDLIAPSLLLNFTCNSLMVNSFS